MYHVKAFHIFQIKTIKDIRCFSTDTTIIKIQELTVSVF